MLPPSWQEKAWQSGFQDMRSLVTLYSQLGSRNKFWYPPGFLFFPLFLQSNPPTHRMVLPAFRVGHLSSIKPLWKCPHRYAQRCDSQVIPNLVKRTMKISHILFFRHIEPPSRDNLKVSYLKQEGLYSEKSAYSVLFLWRSKERIMTQGSMFWRPEICDLKWSRPPQELSSIENTISSQAGSYWLNHLPDPWASPVNRTEANSYTTTKSKIQHYTVSYNGGKARRATGVVLEQWTG